MSDLSAGIETRDRREGADDVLLSNGFSRTQLIIAAGELGRRRRLSGLITGVYPTPRLRGIVERFNLVRMRAFARVVDRAEPISDARVDSLWGAELFERGALPIVGRGRAARDLISIAAMHAYGRRSARVVRAASPSTSIYHYRAGFGHRSLDEARLRNLALLCDHSIVHPAVVEYLVHNDGRLPRPEEAVRPGPFWRSVLADIERADAVVVNSRFVKETFLWAGWLGTKVHVVYLGIDDAFVSALPRRSFDASRERSRLLFAGRFDRRKGADDVVSALAALDRGRWTFSIAGPIDPDVRRRHAVFLRDPNVRVLDTLRRRDLAKVMSETDIFVFPSRAEGSARVVFEALAAGCYVITTPNAGSIVEQHVHGALVPPADPAALTAALAAAMEDTISVASVGKANQATVLSSHRQRNYVDDLERVYASVLESSRS